MIETKTTPEVEKQYEWLNSAIKRVGNGAQMRVAAHLRSVTSGRHYLLPNYHADTLISNDDKSALYKQVFTALCADNGKPDWSKLEGQAGNGSKRVDPLDVPPVVLPASRPVIGAEMSVKLSDDGKEYIPTPVKPRAVEPVKAVEPRTLKPAIASAVGGDSEVADLLAKLLQGRVTAQATGVDADAVEAIADKCARSAVSEAMIEADKEFEAKLKRHLGNGSFPTDRVKEIVEELTRNLALRVEFITAAGEVKPIDGLMHPQVPQVAAWLRSNVPVWAWGAAGSGKTHLARQVAAMLEIEPHVVSVDPTLTVAKLLGYRNVANGGFVEGFLYHAYKSGGLVALDEIDTGDPGVVASINALLSNTHYLFPNGETVERHPKFYTLALANTRGTGAVAGYTARNRLDAATLDRFAVIEIKYDPGLEMALACGQGVPARPWRQGAAAQSAIQKRYVEWVQQVREHVGNSVLISPRVSINGCRALRHGIPMVEIAEALVFKLVADDTRKRITDTCGQPPV
jgi:hypothetical protein